MLDFKLSLKEKFENLFIIGVQDYEVLTIEKPTDYDTPLKS